jgi:hypothetical protein
MEHHPAQVAALTGYSNSIHIQCQRATGFTCLLLSSSSTFTGLSKSAYQSKLRAEADAARRDEEARVQAASTALSAPNSMVSLPKPQESVSNVPGGVTGVRDAVNNGLTEELLGTARLVGGDALMYSG